MNLTRANSAVQQFLDFDGTPLSGGRLCTFIHGTTTPISTYKDKNGTLNECEVRLNSRGECDIWLDPSQSYKFVLKRADGSVVWTKDDITADAVYELPSRIVDTVEGSGDVDVTAVASGNSTKYVVKLTDDFKDEIEDLETAIGNVKDTFYFTSTIKGSDFADAYRKGKFLVLIKSVIVDASTNKVRTRNFYLVHGERVPSGNEVAFLFACLDGETIYKISITLNTVAETLTFGDVESYAIKDTADTIASQVQGKLSSVSHDATLDGDGTQANPLKVIGGGQGGGIPEAPEDGKQYARKDGEWAEVEAGASSWEDIEGKPSTFPPSSHEHSVSDITDFPSIPTATSELENDSGFIDKATFTATYNTTSFADIKSAVDNGYCVKCDVSGYTYELVQALSYKITFALTNNVNGTIAQETIWVYSDDTWDGASVNIAKASDVPSNAVTSTAVTSIVKVTELPEEPDPNTLYLVVEEEATTASDTSESEV